MSFPNDLPYNTNPWLGRAPGGLEYPTYPHEPLSTFSPVQESFELSEPDLLSFHMESGTAHMNHAFPETPRPSRSDFHTSPTDGAYPYTHAHPHAHSPDYARMHHHPRDVPYGTSARLQPKPTSYNPGYSPNAPIESALPKETYPTHRRTSSASSASSSIYNDRSFQQGRFKCKWEGCRYTGAFGRKFELKRHVDTQHISPNSFPCPDPRCGKGYNRRDNLEEHLRRAAHDV
ncbi:hypothetical protein N7494_007165 [Penicillium frequentans]|uniref:C2H2-type domain-containing protein n=1 Tax=Penicillium frequentans TaxID=3151616 RepID=A0AAD6GEH3_9EURO|nr:hypothetical protein N7494_007165 [Penicillium glabrum]